MVLIFLAKAAKVEKAGKAHLSPDRWKQFPAAPLTELPNNLEREAALKRLSTIKAAWIGKYLITAACDPRNGIQVRKAAAKMASRTVKETAQVLGTLPTLLLASDIALPLTTVFSIIKDMPFFDYTNFGPDFELAANAVEETITARQPDITVVLQAQKSLLMILDHVTAIDPAPLLEFATFKALAGIAAICHNAPKDIEKLKDQVIGRLWITAKLVISSSTTTRREEIIDQLRWLSGRLALTRSVCRHYPLERPDLILKQQSDPIESPTASDIYGAVQEGIAELLRLVSPNPDTTEPRVPNDVFSCANELARLTDVVNIGTCGEIVDFEPLKQYLTESDDATPKRVIIRVPGIGTTRKDGTFRIIQKPVVSKP
jgi:hypothetical protein